MKARRFIQFGLLVPILTLAISCPAQDYKPDETILHAARRKQFGATQKRTWTNLAGRTLDGALDWADKEQATISGDRKIVVPLADLSPADVHYIDSLRALFQTERNALDASGPAWRTNPRAMESYLFERLKLQPKPTDGGGIPDFEALLITSGTPLPGTGGRKVVTGFQTVSMGTERRIGYADAEVGFSLWTPAPEPISEVVRPMLGEVVTLELTFLGYAPLKGSDDPLGNLRQTKFDPDRISAAARGKVGPGLELSFSEAEGLRAVLASEPGKGLFTGPYPFVELDFATTDRHASFWKSVKPGQKVNCSGVVTGAIGGAVRGFNDIKFWWSVITISDAGPER